MSKNNVRIAIRDSTDSHNVAFFDNKAGIKYKSANLHRFLAGSASILTIKYNSKDIDSIRSGCKLAFRYKNRDYWLNVMNFEKKGFEVELTAYSLGLELNNETRGEHKPENAMSIAEYVGYYDPEHALTIGVNEVSDKRIKLEWTGTDTILARLFSVANSFGAELDFSVELNGDYSLKRQVLNIYKKGNLGTNKVSQPVRVGKELKVINYSDNIKELRTAVRATGKDGLTIDGLDKKIYDNNKELLYYSSGMTVYAPQSRDRFPSVGKGSNDNWIVEDLGETQYETKEALWAYLYSEIQKKSLPEITYEVEGAIEAGIGDTQTLIDDIHFEPALYVQARVSELEDDILTGKVTKSTFINFERKYSQIADELQKRVNELVEASTPYTIKVSSDNGTVFKNSTGTSTFKARLFKGEKEITSDGSWRWALDGVATVGMQYRVQAKDITDTAMLTVAAYVGNTEVAVTEIDVINVNDGPQGPQGPQGDKGSDGAQGIPGKPGADGKTPYIHFAYADDDKGTNFSLTDNNQQFQGYYSDYTEADSTDYKKYKWVDRLANVQVGGNNLIRQSTSQKGVRLGISEVLINDDKHMLTDWIKIEPSTVYTFTTYEDVNEANMYYSLAWYSTNNADYSGWISRPTGAASADTFKGGKQYKSPANAAYAKVSYPINYSKVKFERGNVSTDYDKAPEDVQEDIDNKADQTLTQDQLNALTENNNLIKAEMEAKASMDTVNQWITAYQNYVNANEADKRKSEQALQDASNRLLQVKYDVNDLKQQWNFIDTYMSVQNEGLIIGKKDGSAYAKFSNDRISLFSGSSEVMYISQGVLRIENGIFTKTIQIGRFRFETHPSDQDMLVLRFLGG